MIYLKWTQDEAEFPQSIRVVYTEVDAEGRVHREIGVDRSGAVVHKKPSAAYPNGRDGFFYRIDLPSVASSIAQAEFEKLWTRA